MPNLIGTGPAQCPTNGDLGKLAFMDIVDTVTNNPYLDTAISDTKPSLLLDFANSKTLDPRITYTRASTATYFDQNGVMQTAAAGVPRFDHDPVTGESKGFLIEEQRTNLMLQSQFASGWFTTNTAITPATIVAPDGTLTGAKAVISAATANSNLFQQNITLAANTTVSMSCYVKYAGVRYVNIGFAYTGGVYAGYQFDVLNGVVVGGGAANGTNVSASITPVGNGWYRCVYVGSLAYANPSIAFLPSNVAYTSGNAWYDVSLTGNGYSGIYIWGAQLEAGSFATSYIPTTSAQVTRSADVASMTGANFSSWYRQDEGTFYSEVSDGKTLDYAWVFDASDASTHYNRITNQIMSSQLATSVNLNNVSQASFSTGAITTSGFKSASTYKTNDIATLVNGATPTTDTSATIPNTIGALYLGRYVEGGNNYYMLNRCFKKLAYYPKRLSDQELAEMTL